MIDALIFKISTKAFPDGRIEQELVDIRGRIMRQVINTQEEQIKKVLVGLGWTPPNESQRRNEQQAVLNVLHEVLDYIKNAAPGRDGLIEYLEARIKCFREL